MNTQVSHIHNSEQSISSMFSGLQDRVKHLSKNKPNETESILEDIRSLDHMVNCEIRNMQGKPTTSHDAESYIKNYCYRINESIRAAETIASYLQCDDPNFDEGGTGFALEVITNHMREQAEYLSKAFDVVFGKPIVRR